MRLFDEFKRTDFAISGYGVPYYTYLNTSARFVPTYIRETLEKWFASYEATELKCKSLLADFKSEKNDSHFAAFFELYIYTLFNKLGYAVEVEPPWKKNSPDFLLTKIDGQQILIETTSTYPVSEFGWQKQQVNQIVDYLNTHLRCPNFFLHMDVLSSVSGTIPFARMKRYLQRKVDELDYDETVQLALSKPNSGFERFPLISWKNDNWTVDFRVIPTKIKGTVERPVGSQSFQVMVNRSSEEIKNTIHGKTSHYGELEIPYIIMVNSFSLMEDDDMMDALFGDTSVSIDWESTETKLLRIPNGVWYGPNGYKNRRVTAVGIFKGLRPANMPYVNVKLLHHPYPNHPIIPSTLPFTQMFLNEESQKYEMHTGQNLNNILNIDESVWSR